MTSESIYRGAFFLLLMALLVMRVYFMLKVKISGGRIMPDEKASAREGGRGVYIFRVVVFFALIIFLVMYLLGSGWINSFTFSLPAWLHWIGFGIGIVTVGFWTWVQIVLDAQWSAQLQLTEGHHLITTGPYSRIRHPLYTAIINWCFSLTLLTANWIFFALCVFSFIGILWRIPKEEQMMIEAFGSEYKEYIKRTNRFFPKIKKE